MKKTFALLCLVAKILARECPCDPADPDTGRDCPHDGDLVDVLCNCRPAAACTDASCEAFPGCSMSGSGNRRSCVCTGGYTWNEYTCEPVMCCTGTGSVEDPGDLGQTLCP